MNQKYITRLFEKWNLKYALAHNGQEAVDFCQDTKCCMIFMDLQMPVMDGFEATKEIRSSDNPNISTPIVALTASTLLSKKQHALNSGMTDFLSKPFNPKQLSRVIMAHIPILSSFSQEQNSSTSYQFNPSLDAQYLKETYEDDLEYCVDIMETFLDSVPPELDNLRLASFKDDYSAFAKIAHKLKPTFTTVSYTHLTLPTKRIV